MENKLEITASEIVRANRFNSRHERRQALLHAACTEIAALRQNGVRIGRAITFVARKFLGRYLGDGRSLALSSKSMRRHWCLWNSAGRAASVFRSRYKPGHPKIEIAPGLLSLIEEFCVRRGHSLLCFVRVFKPRTADGRPIAEWTLYRRLKASKIRYLTFCYQTSIRNARDFQQHQNILVRRVIGETVR